MFHLRDLASGKKKIIKASSVKTIQIPHFKGLEMSTMLENSKNFPNVAKSLPDPQTELDKLPRAVSFSFFNIKPFV